MACCAEAPSRPARDFGGTGRQSVPCPDSAAFSRGFPGSRLPIRLSKAFLLSSRSRKKNVSPYDVPSSNDNQMRALLTELIDFDRLRMQERIQLSVCATNARTARRRVFTNPEL